MGAPAPPPRRRVRRKTPGGYVALGLVVALGVQAGGVQLPEQWPAALLAAEELDKEDNEASISLSGRHFARGYPFRQRWYPEVSMNQFWEAVLCRGFRSPYG